MRQLLTVCVALALFNVDYAVAGWVTLNKPGASDTLLQGIDGDNIVGYYSTDTPLDVVHGCLHSGTTWTTLDVPSNMPGGPYGTLLKDIDCDNIVGSAGGHGYLYNKTSQTWKNIDTPVFGANNCPTSVSGSNVVGCYSDTVNHGFLYNMVTETCLTAFDVTGSVDTNIMGIDGNIIVGGYHAGRTDNPQHGFICDITDPTHPLWTTGLDMPGAIDTVLIGINGNNIVGGYDVKDENGTYVSHGLLYNMLTQTWATIDMPGACSTVPNGIDRDNIVGYFGDPQGFVYTIPEPGTIAMLTSAGLFLLFGVWRYRSRK